MSSFMWSKLNIPPDTLDFQKLCSNSDFVDLDYFTSSEGLLHLKLGLIHKSKITDGGHDLKAAAEELLETVLVATSQ